jgi:hypothetical protein
LCAERRSKGRRARHALADDHRRDLVELYAAIRFWRVNTKQAERAGATNEIARQPPVFLLELIQGRQHFVAHEITDGLRDEPVFVAQLFRREYTAGSDGCRSHSPPRNAGAAEVVYAVSLFQFNS